MNITDVCYMVNESLNSENFILIYVYESEKIGKE